MANKYKVTNKKIEENPLDQLSGLVETKTETKKEKGKEEILIPLTVEQKQKVASLIEKHENKEKAIVEYENELIELKENVFDAFYVKESFELKKNLGSFYAEEETKDKRIQYVPSDSFSNITVSKTDSIKDKIERIKEIVGENFYDKFITKINEIKIKSSVMEDKEKLSKFVSLIKVNPEIANYFEITESYQVIKGGLDMSFQLTNAKREKLLTEVKLKSASVKCGQKPEFK
jgi:hypothetical protein